MSKIIIFLILVMLNCGNGPAEDRGKRNCQNEILSTIGLLEHVKDSKYLDRDSNLTIYALLSMVTIKYECSASSRDNLRERYYRGYIEGKK